MATWNESAGNGRPPLRLQRTRPVQGTSQQPLPRGSDLPPPHASSSKIDGPRALNQWEKNVKSFRSAQWPGLEILFGKDRSLAGGFTIEVDGSRLLLLDHAIPNPHNLVHSTNFFLNPTNGSVEVKEILSASGEGPIMILSRTALVKTGDFTVLRSDNQEGEDPSENFYIQILLKQDVHFRLAPYKHNDRIDPGEQAQAMFLSRLGSSMKALMYLEVCIPNYRPDFDPQGASFSKESEVQLVLHGQDLHDVKSNGEAFCAAPRPSMAASRHASPQPAPAPIPVTSQSPQQSSAGSSLYVSKYVPPTPAPIPIPTSTPIPAPARTSLMFSCTGTPEPDHSTDVSSKIRVVEEKILRVIGTESNMQRASVSLDRLEYYLERSIERAGPSASHGAVSFASYVFSEATRLVEEDNPLPAQLVDLFVVMAGLRVQQKEEQRKGDGWGLDWSLIPQ